MIQSPLFRGWYRVAPPIVSGASRHPLYGPGIALDSELMTPQLPKNPFGELAPTPIEERKLTVIEGARLIGYEGFLVLPDGSFSLESVHGYRDYLTSHPAYFKKNRPSLRKIKGNYVSFMGLFCREHYHVVHEGLSRPYRLLDYLPQDVRWIIPEVIIRQYGSWLKKVGIQLDRVEIYGDQDYVEVERLYDAPPALPSKRDSREPLMWLKRQLQPRKERCDRRIYISRRLAARRRLVNESEWEPLLKKSGFEFIVLESISREEQLQVFAEASVVIAPHGAGLVHLFACDPGTQVLECFDPSNLNSCYASMAIACELNYQAAVGSTVVNRNNEPDMKIEVDELNLFLKRLN